MLLGHLTLNLHNAGWRIIDQALMNTTDECKARKVIVETVRAFMEKHNMWTIEDEESSVSASIETDNQPQLTQ